MLDHEDHPCETQLTIIIPALNEELRLPLSLQRICSYVGARDELMPAEIIVVDDGSSDGTAEVVRAPSTTVGVRIAVRSHVSNLGKGAAIRTGLRSSNGHQILLCDADLSTPIEEIEILRRVADRKTVVIGSRAVDRRLITTRQPWYRDSMGRVFNMTEQIIVLRGIADTQCGFKLFPGALGRALAAVQRIDGFAFDVELLLLSQHWGYEVREVGVRWAHVEASRVQPIRHSAQMLRDLFRLGWWRLSGRLPEPPHRLTADADGTE